jgi:hypothetical protein
MCSCGCDLFSDLRDELRHCCTYINEPIEINGVMTNVFKEHNYKYCECFINGRKNEVHCGDAEFECHARLDKISQDWTTATFKCNKSGYNVIILRDNDEEVEQRKKEYFILPGEINWDGIERNAYVQASDRRKERFRHVARETSSTSKSR